MSYSNLDCAKLQPRTIGSSVLFALMVLVGVLISLLIAPGVDGLMGAYLATLMGAIAANDARHYLIPNELSAAAFGLALLRAGAIMPDSGVSSMLLASFRAAMVALPLLLLLLFYRYWRRRDGLGLGDVKLAAVAGAWLEFTTVAVVIELAALSAIAAYTANAVIRKRPLRATAFLPFGFFLAPSIWVGWLCERWLVDWVKVWGG
ncbi:prepilin peptidase [Bradyrhizobium sp. RDM4]|uniref:prepilin peptidase n=1 Tax=Bradyrhizobium sp. RDM4 TaxID=3378765 RepID=UPI0038FC78E6